MQVLSYIFAFIVLLFSGFFTFKMIRALIIDIKERKNNKDDKDNLQN